MIFFVCITKDGNNKSVLWLLTDSNLSATELVEEPKNISHVTSPLILTENFPGKKRLTLDLSYVNKQICMHKVKLDGWKCPQNSLNTGIKCLTLTLNMCTFTQIKNLLRILVENWWKSWIFYSYSFVSRTWFSLGSDWRGNSSFCKLLPQESVKGSVFLGLYS